MAAVITTGLIGSIILPAGCTASAPQSRHTATLPQVDRGSIPVPPGLEADVVNRHDEQAMARATMDLSRIIATLERPDYLPEQPPATTPATQPGVRPATAVPAPAEADDLDEQDATAGEWSLAAQRAYVQGRQALHEGRTYDAVRYLTVAEQQAPDEPQILRMLGQAHFRSGLRTRGVRYLEQVVALDPQDVVSLYYLGRDAVDRREWDAALATFSFALDQKAGNRRVDAGIWPILHYSLAGLLEQQRYDLAALEQFREFLDATAHPITNTRFAVDLRVLQRQMPAAWITIGDAYCRLGESATALEAYENARARSDEERPELLSRIIHAHLRLANTEAAARELIESLARDPQSQSLELVGYLGEQGVDTASFARNIEAIYENAQRPTHLALAMGQLLDRDDALAMYESHLHARPEDQAVFRSALALLLSPDDTAPQTGEPAEEVEPAADDSAAADQRTTAGASDAAVRRAAMLTHQMHRRVNIRRAQQYTGYLFSAVGDAAGVAAAIEQAAGQERDQLRHIEAIALHRAGDALQAERLYRIAMGAMPGRDLIRLGLAELLIEERAFDDALTVIEAAQEPDLGPLMILRTRALAALGRDEEALALLNRALEQYSGEVHLYLAKAEIEQRRKDDSAAERTLLQALNHRPDAEAIYLALRDIYSRGNVAGAAHRRNQLHERALRNIPHTTFGQVVRAEALHQQGRSEEAITLLESILDQNPAEVSAVTALTGIYLTQRRFDKATELIQSMLREHPDDARITELGITYFVATEQHAPLAELLERELLAGRADEPEHEISYYLFLMYRLDRLEQVEQTIEQIIQRYPEQATNLRYHHASMLLMAEEDSARAEALLLKVLQADPNHPSANNDLGYTWVDSDRNLDEALRMIQIAVAARPEEAAYRDSLGWAYYKLGRFDEAVRELNTALRLRQDDPVIADHLGDALYRSGDRNAAAERWREALRSYSRMRSQDPATVDSPELTALADNLRRKLTALAEDRQPPVASSPGSEEQ